MTTEEQHEQHEQHGDQAQQPPRTPQADREDRLTEQVVESFRGASSERYRQVMQSLVRHAHAFVREVRLTEDEWQQAVSFLTRCGHITDDKRQELILLSDVLGLSMLTIAVNQPPEPEVTEATVVGPFFVEGAPQVSFGEDIARGATGEPCWFEGTVRGSDGAPVPNARLDVWEADSEGRYDVQHPGGRSAGRAHLFTDDEGRYGFWGVTPTSYPIPHDGPVGDLLAAAGRGPMRPAHLHVMVSAPGHRRLVTHLFVAGDPYLGDDAVFGVQDSLVVGLHRQQPGTPTPTGRTVEGHWARARFDVVLGATPPPGAPL